MCYSAFLPYFMVTPRRKGRGSLDRRVRAPGPSMGRGVFTQKEPLAPSHSAWISGKEIAESGASGKLDRGGSAGWWGVERENMPFGRCVGPGAESMMCGQRIFARAQPKSPERGLYDQGVGRGL